MALIDELRKREAELSPLIDTLREQLVPLERELEVVRQAIIGLGGGRTIKETVLQYLDQRDGPATISEMVRDLQIDGSTLRPQLHRLKAEGRVFGIRGKWNLSEISKGSSEPTH